MATKDQMRKGILNFEPDNEIARSSDASHDQLKKEFASAKRRDTSSRSANAISVICSYRLEANSKLSWKLCRKDTGEAMTPLDFGVELPLVGDVIDLDGIILKISSQAEGLGIVSGDLPVREKFDPRRIYTTPNGTSVVFKRQDKERVVLWSYKVQNEIALNAKIAFSRTDREAKPTATHAKKMTQKVLASYLISQDPAITGKTLTSELVKAFPSAHIGQRHGPHYLSLSKNGKLPEAPDDDPREW